MKHKRALRVGFFVVLLGALLPLQTYASSGFFESIVCKATSFFGFPCVEPWEPMVVVVPEKIFVAESKENKTPSETEIVPVTSTIPVQTRVGKTVASTVQNITNYITNPVTVVYKTLSAPTVGETDTSDFVSSAFFRKQTERTQDNASENLRDSLDALASSFETGAFSLTGAFTDGLGSKGNNGFVLQSTGAGVRWVATSSLGISGGVGTGITSLNGQLEVAQSFASSTTGTDFKITSSGGVHTFQLPSASATARGLLTASDWSSFNSRIASSSLNTSAKLMGLLADETGNGALVFGTSPTIFGATLNGYTNIAYASTTNLTLRGTVYDVTNTAGTKGYILLTSGTSTRWVATSTLGLGGGGSSSFLSLTDVPSSFNASRIPYTNPGATALIDSDNFTFDGATLSVSRSLEERLAFISTPGTRVITSYSTSTFAKPLIINATTDSSNTSPSFGIPSIQLRSLGTTMLYLDTSGVGIATSTPLHTLSVAGDVYATGSIYDNTNSAGTNGMVLKSTGTGFRWVATSTLGIGGGTSSFLTLSDVGIGSFNTGRLLFETGSAVTDSASLTFANSKLTAPIFNASGASTTVFSVNGTSLLKESVSAESLVLGRGANGILGSGNVAIGKSALELATTSASQYNVAVGLLSQQLNISGNNNTSLGAYSLEYNATGSDNVAIGYSAALSTVSSRNIAIGSWSLANAYGPSSEKNIAIGYYAGFNLESGANNTLLGYQAGDALTSGSNNIAIGYDVDLPSNTATNQLTIGNLIFGTGIDGTGTTLSSGNVGIGTSTPTSKLTVAGDSNFTGTLSLSGSAANIALGSNYLSGDGGDEGLYIDANGNVAIGTSSAKYSLRVASTSPKFLLSDSNSSTSISNWVMGNQNGVLTFASAGTNFDFPNGQQFALDAQNSNIYGGYTYFGSTNTTGANNIAFGDAALNANTEGSRNVAFGFSTLKSNETGLYNTAIGDSALMNNVSGSRNIGIGQNALRLNLSANNNVGIGTDALYAAKGSYNTGLGYQSLTSLSGGINNVGIGRLSGDSMTYATSSTFLGAFTDASMDNLSTSTAIGAGAIVGCSQCLVLGGTGLNAVNVGIGTSTPSKTLTVVGQSLFTDTINLASTSEQISFSSGYIGLLSSTPDALIEFFTPNNSMQLDTERTYIEKRITTAGGTINRPGLSFHSDESTGMLNASSSLIFSVWGVERMRMTNGGLTGIGTSTPTSKLTVAGDSNFTGTLSLSGSAANIALGSNWLSGDGGDEGVFIDAGGNVGFGTSTPQGAFHLSVSSPMFYLTDTDTGSDSRISAASGSGALYIDADMNSEATGLMGFRVHGAEYMRITNNGNIGIGDTTPDNLLDIASSTAQSALSIFSGGTDTDALIKFELTDNSPLFTMGIDDSDADKFKISGSALGTNDRLVIDSSGNIGVGTSSPATKLNIVGNGAILRNTFTSTTSNTVIQVKNDLTATLDMRIYGSSANGGLLGQTRAGTAFVYADNVDLALGTADANFLALSTNNLERLRIDSSGNVGIGTTTPSQKLSISGNLRLTGALYDSTNSAGTLGQILKSTATGQQWVATSTLGLSSSFTTSAQLAALLSDETGSGRSVFSDSPAFSGTVTFSALSATSTLTLSGTAANIALGSNYLSGDGGDEGVFVDSLGRVGIGTSTPSSKLTIHALNGETNQTLFRIASSTSATTTSLVTINNQGSAVFAGPVYSKGVTWTARSASEVSGWLSVTYGNGIFVAVANSGTNRVMTSPDGIVWTSRSVPEATNQWVSVTYGNGVFVAVGASGTNRVMTSPDGVTWTARAATEANSWNSVTYGNGLFVAVSLGGTNRVMTSPDGITWTPRSASEANTWTSVTYANGLFVAVSLDGTNQVMTSSDGITWSPQAESSANQWYSVTYGNGLFVAVSYNGTNRVMTSANGTSWTTRTAPEASGWTAITYGNGLFVATAITGSNRVMTSPDGLTWTPRKSTESNQWYSVVYANGIFVSVANTGTNRVMTSGQPEASLLAHNNIYQGGLSLMGGNIGIGTTTATSKLSIIGQAGSTQDVFSVSSSTATKFLTVKSTGNVGIGTSTPSYKLTVAGNARITGALYDNLNSAGINGMVLKSTGTGFAWAATSTLGFSSAFTTSAQLAALLSDETGSGRNVFSVSPAFSGTATFSALTATSTLTLSGTAANIALGSNYLSGDGGDEGVFVDSSGNVGIGTLTPSAKFEVIGDIVSKGTSWTSRNSAEANQWTSLAYGNGIYVAVSQDGTNRVMTSSDGVSWTTRSASEANSWQSVTYGNGLFVAVSADGTNRVMTSPDGVTWTARSAAAANSWFSVTYGNGLFVAVGIDGASRVMTSPDGITWTGRSAATAKAWSSVAYGNGLFVAIAQNGTTDYAMSSTDGITWTTRNSAEANQWSSLTYGNGLFVAVANSGTNRVMTSSDGATWTARSVSSIATWNAVTYGNGLFVAVANSGTDRVVTSPDGITWTARTASAANAWFTVAYGNGRFVSIARTGTTGYVMTSGQPETSLLAHNNIYQGGLSIMGGNIGIGTTTATSKLSIIGQAGSAQDIFSVSSSTATKFLTVKSSGNVGIGTSTALQRLTVSASSTSGYAARIINTNNSVDADGLLISLGVANASRGTGNYFIGFSTLDGTVAGKIQGGASAVAYTTTAADLAEYFPVDPDDEMPEPGEIVTLDTATNRSVKKAENTDTPFGIITTNPGFIGNAAICKAKDTKCDAKYAQKNALVSLVGQVPLKVSTENGAIKKGDSITISSVAGVGKRANFGDTSVGYALEDTQSDALLDTITVFANLHTAFGMNPDPALFVTTENPTGESDLTGKGILQKMAQLVQGFVDGVLTVAGLRTHELCIDDSDGSTCIDRTQLKALLQGAADTSGDTDTPAPVDGGNDSDDEGDTEGSVTGADGEIGVGDATGTTAQNDTQSEADTNADVGTDTNTDTSGTGTDTGNVVVTE